MINKINTIISVLQKVSKFIVALIAALGVLAVSLQGGLTTEEIISVGVAFLGALGVYQVRNK